MSVNLLLSVPPSTTTHSMVPNWHITSIPNQSANFCDVTRFSGHISAHLLRDSLGKTSQCNPSSVLSMYTLSILTRCDRCPQFKLFRCSFYCHYLFCSHYLHDYTQRVTTTYMSGHRCHLTTFCNHFSLLWWPLNSAPAATTILLFSILEKAMADGSLVFRLG
jgi:hypothetical protein